MISLRWPPIGFGKVDQRSTVRFWAHPDRLKRAFPHPRRRRNGLASVSDPAHFSLQLGAPPRRPLPSPRVACHGLCSYSCHPRDLFEVSLVVDGSAVFPLLENQFGILADVHETHTVIDGVAVQGQQVVQARAWPKRVFKRSALGAPSPACP